MITVLWFWNLVLLSKSVPVLYFSIKTHFYISGIKERWAQACSRQEKQDKRKEKQDKNVHINRKRQTHSSCTPWVRMVEIIEGQILKAYPSKEISTAFGTFNLKSPLKYFSWENHNEANEAFYTSLSLVFCKQMWKVLTLLYQLLNRYVIYTLTSFPASAFHRGPSLGTKWILVITFV